MVRPLTLDPKPSYDVALLGGLVATILLSALLFIGPVLGFPYVDFPHLIGGVLTDEVTAAPWLGFWIFFLVGWFVWPVLLVTLWSKLPGNTRSFVGAALKGLALGLGLWVLSGLLIPVFGWLNQLTDQGLESPGLFAYRQGLLAPIGVLLGHLAYGLALALVAAMGRGISPMETVGWESFHKGSTARDRPRVSTHGA